jgi:hypothetical protein
MTRTIPPLPAARLMPLSKVRDPRPAALVTSGPAWQAVQAHAARA